MIVQPPVPNLPPPQKTTVKALSAPVLQRPTVWAFALAVLLELPNLVDLVTPILTAKQVSTLHALAVLAAALAGIFARQAGVNSSAQAVDLHRADFAAAVGPVPAAEEQDLFVEGTVRPPKRHS